MTYRLGWRKFPPQKCKRIAVSGGSQDAMQWMWPDPPQGRRKHGDEKLVDPRAFWTMIPHNGNAGGPGCEMGMSPSPTSSAEEALKLVQYGRCRLVLVDVHMPEMDGYEFLDAPLRGDPGLHVVMTGEYTLESALEPCARATDFLPETNRSRAAEAHAG